LKIAQRRALRVFRKIFVVIFAAIIIVGMTGCSKNKSTGTTSKSVTLYWWRSVDDAPQATLTEMVTSFMQDNPNITIKLRLKNPTTLEEEARNALAAYKTTPDAPDIISLPAEEIPDMAQSLVPFPDNYFDTGSTKTGKSAAEYIASLFEPGAAKAVILNDPKSGRAFVYGLPIAIDTLSLFVNTDLIQQSADNLKTTQKTNTQLTDEQVRTITKQLQAAPKTWKDLTDVVPYLRTVQGDQVIKAAIAMGASINVERSYDILSTIMMQNGTQMTSKALDQATFNLVQAGAVNSTNPGERALAFYMQFSNPKSPLYTWNNQMPNSVEAFKSGQLVMMFHYASAYRSIIQTTPSLKSKIQIYPVPQLTTPDSPNAAASIKTMERMLVECATSAKNDPSNNIRSNASMKFIQYMTMNRTGSKAYLKAMQLPSALKQDPTQTTSSDSAFVQQTTIADGWYKGKDALGVDVIFITMINGVSQGQDRQQALDAAARDVTTILQGSSYKWGTAQRTNSQTTDNATATNGQ